MKASFRFDFDIHSGAPRLTDLYSTIRLDITQFCRGRKRSDLSAALEDAFNSSSPLQRRIDAANSELLIYTPWKEFVYEVKWLESEGTGNCSVKMRSDLHGCNICSREILSIDESTCDDCLSRIYRYGSH